MYYKTSEGILRIINVNEKMPEFFEGKEYEIEKDMIRNVSIKQIALDTYQRLQESEIAEFIKEKLK